MIEFQVTGIQNPIGRKTPYVRVFGYRRGDPRERIVEVALTMEDANDIIQLAMKGMDFPIIEVPSRACAIVLNPGDLEVIYKKDKS